MNNKDVGRRDRYSIMALCAADQAMADSGIDINREDPVRCGVCVGTGIGGIETMQDNVTAFATKGPRRVSPFAVPKCLANMATGEIAIRFGFRGPNKSVVTACAAATQSMGEAAMLIKLGIVDVMISGGAEGAVIPFGMAAFAAMRAMSTRNDDPEHASRPFDMERDGFVMGDGAGVLVLESEAHAKARGAKIYGEIIGFAETCDAHHITAPSSDGAGAIGAMHGALRSAGLNPDQIQYFNAHGTSTKLNDESESLALRTVFGDSMPPVSSTKSMIGHLLGAAGAVEAIACLMTIRDGIIHPNINYENPDPGCQINLVANTSREAKVDIAMSNSLGFGGHNASIILKRYE
jgi:3-oxoacyl-[acyl-carrier-protein] synthase II